MKAIPTFEEFLRENASEEFLYHMDRGMGITDSVFRIGSDAYRNLFEETKQYWDSGNVILNSKEGWMAKNLEVGKKAKYKTEDGKWISVKLDEPQRGGKKKYFVYHNSGRTDKEGNIIAKKIEWGDPSRTVKNDDPGRAASFWARHRCDLKDDPSTPGWWACFAPSLYNKQLGLQSDAPW